MAYPNKVSPLYFLVLFTIPFYFPVLSLLFSHPAQTDRQIRFLYHCGENAHTKPDSEGRGGISSLVQYVQSSEENLVLQKGRTYFLFPFSGKQNEKLKTLAYQGIWEQAEKPLFLVDSKFGDIRLGITKDTLFQKDKDYSEYDSILLFSESPEPSMDFPANPDLPFFIIRKENKTAKLTFLGSVHSLYCPTEYGKLGELDLTFRGRNLIRYHGREVSLNLPDRNRSWIPKSESVEEEGLPSPKPIDLAMKKPEKKDKETAKGKKSIQEFVPYSYVDREILGTETGFSKTPSGQAP